MSINIVNNEYTVYFVIYFIRPTICTYKYLWMISVHSYMFWQPIAILCEPHKCLKPTELWYSLLCYNTQYHNRITALLKKPLCPQNFYLPFNHVTQLLASEHHLNYRMLFKLLLVSSISQLCCTYPVIGEIPYFFYHFLNSDILS